MPNSAYREIGTPGSAGGHGKRTRGNPGTAPVSDPTLIDGSVVRRVVVTLDATMTTATVLTRAQAVEVGQAILKAAR